MTGLPLFDLAEPEPGVSPDPAIVPARDCVPLAGTSPDPEAVTETGVFRFCDREPIADFYMVFSAYGSRPISCCLKTIEEYRTLKAWWGLPQAVRWSYQPVAGARQCCQKGTVNQ